MVKGTLGRSDVSAQKEARNTRKLFQFLSDYSEVLRLASGGYEAFEAQTAKRILEECGDSVFLNYCVQVRRAGTNSDCQTVPVLRLGLA
jgi:hypothetical protein